MDKDGALAQYAAACQAMADEYIERSTRFGTADLTLLQASPQTRCFKIKVQHSLEVISEAKDYQGVVKPGENDLSTADWAWYQEQVEQQAQAELGRKETLDSLVTAVKSQPYATYSDRTHIRSHPRRLFHTYKCGTCHGSGRVTCHGCGGSGTVTCGGCGGTGRVSCSTCFGTGSVSETHQVRDYTGHYRTETRYRSCYCCSGGRVTCSRCGGRGRNTCGTCGGSGQVKCGTCDGHGYLTRITATSTYTIPKFSGLYSESTPDYVHEALSKAGFKNLEAYGVIELNAVDLAYEHAKVDFEYRSTMNFCELSLEISGHESAWALYGSPPRIHDAGGILEALLKDDFARLDTLGTGWSRILPWFHRRAQRAVQPFMESEVHQDVVSADHQGLASSAIVERVNRSLSEEYIQQSLSRLRQSLKTVLYWSRLKWTLGIALSSIPAIVSAITFIERSKPHTMLVTQHHLVLFPWMGGSETPWTIAFVTIPLSVAGWLVARWASSRWIRRVGGKPLVEWARGKGLLMGRWTAAAIVASTTIVAATFFSKWPVWIDRDGALYGTLAVFQPPQLIEPAVLRNTRRKY